MNKVNSTFSILWMTSRPSSGSKAVIVLPAVAFALVTALLLIVLAGGLSFFTNVPPDDEFGTAGAYQLLAVLAVSLMILPMLTLGGSAARLSARRRDERLSTLRLLGATPALVSVLTVVESTMVAVVGVATGVLLYAAALPAIALIPFRGEALGLANLWLPAGVLLLGAAALILLAAVSAAVGLRQVVLSPLGVRTRQKAPTVHWLRLALGGGAAVVLYMVMNSATSSASLATMVVMVCGGFAGGLALLNLLGPFVLKWLAGRGLRKAQTPVRLLAARTVLESPKAAWRQVSSLSMTSFIAVVAGTGLALLAGVGEAGSQEELNLTNDMRTGVLITVVASFLLVAASAGVNQAAAVLDRRELYVSLDRLGMPRAVMDAARKRAVMWPVRLVTVGSAAMAAILLFPLTGAAMIFAPFHFWSSPGCWLAGSRWCGWVWPRRLLCSRRSWRSRALILRSVNTRTVRRLWRGTPFVHNQSQLQASWPRCGPGKLTGVLAGLAGRHGVQRDVHALWLAVADEVQLHSGSARLFTNCCRQFGRVRDGAVAQLRHDVTLLQACLRGGAFRSHIGNGGTAGEGAA